MSLLERFSSDTGIVLNGNDVRDWVGKENSILLQQLTAIEQPAFIENAHNGHNALRFANSESVTALNTTDLVIGTDSFTLVAVVLSSGGNGRLHGKGDPAGGAGDQYMQYANGGTDKFHGKVGDGTNSRDHTGASANIDLSNHNIVITTFDTSTNVLTHYVNGVLEDSVRIDFGATVGDIDAAAKKYSIGQLSDEGNFFNGDIMLVEIWNSVENAAAKFTELDDFYSNPPVIGEEGGIIPSILSPILSPAMPKIL